MKVIQVWAFVHDPAAECALILPGRCMTLTEMG
jgi:hypothetical protein